MNSDCWSSHSSKLGRPLVQFALALPKCNFFRFNKFEESEIPNQPGTRIHSKLQSPPSSIQKDERWKGKIKNFDQIFFDHYFVDQNFRSKFFRSIFSIKILSINIFDLFLRTAFSYILQFRFPYWICLLVETGK